MHRRTSSRASEWWRRFAWEYRRSLLVLQPETSPPEASVTSRRISPLRGQTDDKRGVALFALTNQPVNWASSLIDVARTYAASVFVPNNSAPATAPAVDRVTGDAGTDQLKPPQATLGEILPCGQDSSVAWSRRSESTYRMASRRKRLRSKELE